MPNLFFITHPDVVIDAAVPVPRWPLSELGRSRMGRFAASGFLRDVSAVYASSERKAVDGAEIVAQALGLSVTIREALGENDRSATGFLPPPEFWPVVQKFFAEPEASVRGWERAVDAQSRIVTALAAIARQDLTAGDVAVVAHGGVGALLLAHLQGEPIRPGFGQPHPKGGCFLTLDRTTLALREGWRTIEDV
jgi:broad specificity phosphatase PhoE